MKTSRTPFWKSLLQFNTCCLAGKTLRKKTVTVVKTDDEKTLRENKATARAFTESIQWKGSRLLGEGAFGRVVLHIDAVTGFKVAKKTVPLDSSSKKLNEGIIHCQLKHPNIINMFCWERSANAVTMFMEYCSGGDLMSILDSLRTDDALEYFSQLMKGVAYLHSRGVVHRDLKLANLLLSEDKVLKIADFGLAEVFMVEGKEVRLHGVMGTRPYMAPEVLKERRYLGPPVDLWACGIILLELLGKVRPWKEANPEDTRPWGWLSDSSKAIVDILLQTDPVQRLSGWREFCQE
ncbi:serine/threonine-protein kinase Chk1-like [Oratosquilla oratoria]|uniref:serine/threonine-protein kinase Chk1-like n=1 Tax=Oratosquilla oratoria TaxID=337810 RepID=UPI003F764FC2